MFDKNICYRQSNLSAFIIRSITEKDLEDLRVWKNRNKSYFFLKEDITATQQYLWFEKFMSNDHDFMFVVEQEVNDSKVKIGCMGFRILEVDQMIDAYNIMRFHKTDNKSYNMADVFKTMLKYASNRYKNHTITVKVLKSNPAISWYTDKVGFTFVKEFEDFSLYQMDRSNLDNISIKILNSASV